MFSVTLTWFGFLHVFCISHMILFRCSLNFPYFWCVSYKFAVYPTWICSSNDFSVSHIVVFPTCLQCQAHVLRQTANRNSYSVYLVTLLWHVRLVKCTATSCSVNRLSPSLGCGYLLYLQNTIGLLIAYPIDMHIAQSVSLVGRPCLSGISYDLIVVAFSDDWIL